MKHAFDDTDPQTQRVQLELMRSAPEWRRIEIMCGMIETLQQLVLSGVRQRHPGASEVEVRRRAADILLGTELAREAYGPPTSGSSA